MGFLSNLFGGGAAKAAKKAAGIQSETAKRGENLAGQTTNLGLADLDRALSGALGQFDQASGALSPYATAGTGALAQLQAALGLSGQGASDTFRRNFQAGPGYQFAMDQGTQALDRSASSRGGLYSGAAGKALTGFGQGLANQEFGGVLDRLSSLVSGGQNAAGGIASIFGNKADAMLGTGQNKANVRMSGLQSILDAIYQGGAARAGGVVGAANAKTNALNNLLGLGGTLGGALLGRR